MTDEQTNRIPVSDLIDYDAMIVEAAQDFVAVNSDEEEWFYQRLEEAVEAKRRASLPRCCQTLYSPPQVCNAPAVQEISDHSGFFHRCEEHRMNVKELR